MITLTEKVQNILPYVDRYLIFGSQYGDYIDVTSFQINIKGIQHLCQLGLKMFIGIMYV